MKNKLKLSLVAVLSILTLASCGEVSSSSSSEPSSDLTSSSDIDVPSSDTSSQEIIPSVDISKLRHIHFDKRSIRDSLMGYKNGSYGEFRFENFNFGFYRAYKGYDDTIKLIKQSSFAKVDSLPSALYNIEPIYDIKRIDVEYEYLSYNDDDLVLKYGKDRSLENEYVLPNEYGVTKRSIYLNDANFFSLQSLYNDVSIKNVDIYYSNNRNQYDNKKFLSGDGQIRFNLEMADRKSLVHNHTKIELPTKIEEINGEYYVSETKTYTYYDYQEIRNDRSLAKEASLTNPTDVINYYIAFGEAPCNYVYKNYFSEAHGIFGKDTRCISTYSRTGGYAKSVPYKTKPGESKPIYHELDVALDDLYNSSNRGSGRIVIWEYGFDENKGAKGYNQKQPIGVYTDDHYATFKEYYGAGIFSPNFDAEKSRTNRIWSNPKTIELKTK